MVGVGGIIMNTQLVSIVVMIVTENIGWTKIYIATRRIGLKGSSAQRPSVALNLKISFPLLITTKVCKINKVTKIDYINKLCFLPQNNVNNTRYPLQKQTMLKSIWIKTLILYLLLVYCFKHCITQMSIILGKNQIKQLLLDTLI